MRYLVFFLWLWGLNASAKSIVNVYNWADYMPLEVIKQFEKETGIQVNYTEYDSNETMYTKLKSNPNLDYDVIFPSAYYVQRMTKEQMLLPLDKKKLTHLGYLNQFLLKQKNFDPNNAYSIPYLWGTTGIVVNKKYINPQGIKSWGDLWQPKFKNQLLLFDDMRQVFAIALWHLGYSINDTNQDHIKQAYQELKKLWPNIKLFSSEAEQNIYIDEDAYIGTGLNGEIYKASFENKNLVYIYPAEGFEIWMDTMAIPLHARHVREALTFIDFLLRPEIAKKIAMYTGFSTPNQEAMSLLPASMRKNPMINPDDKTMQRGHLIMDLGEANLLYEAYWNKLKVGD